MSREQTLNPIPEEIRRGHEQTICLMSEDLAGLMWTADERYRATHQIPVANNGIEFGYTIVDQDDIFILHNAYSQLELIYSRRVHGFGIGGSEFWIDKKWAFHKLTLDLHVDEKTRKAVEKRGHHLFVGTWYAFNPDGTIEKRIENPHVRGDKRSVHPGRWGDTFIETPVESEAEYELIGGILTQMTLAVKKASS